ncbi:uncharacterized protein KD926_006131 [Aspergillus affinis]|uniref:uncharacterized protein n=1 Tax=Aspergillus affinis TaxID=1070780 RepID=UPI0022FE364D|nr:uncharacterized protein KD926_006131 [Aspergillus affinis]KAI9034744.1 hypothetical protein KD926_006131 [Aspergillus affinis]
MLSGNKAVAKPIGDEATQYLDSDPVEAEPFQFWRNNQSRFSAIALLARDALSIPATGTDVERLFNTARNVCYYRCSRLKSETIEKIMLFLYVSRFDLKDTEAKELKKYFTLNEIETSKEQSNENLKDVRVNLISDNEKEEEEEEEDTEIVTSKSFNELIDFGTASDTEELQLPENRIQLQTFGRKRKHKEDNDFEQY